MNKWAWLLGVLLAGCGASGDADTGSTSGSCVAGSSRACTCDGGKGTQTCSGGAWTACACSLLDAAVVDAKSDAPAECGDLYCEADKGETCELCPVDCGECPKCDLAPTCTGAFSVPTQTKALSDFDNDGKTSYVSGVGMGVPPSATSCTAPKLKIRVASITVNLNGTGWSDLDMFCMVEANDGVSSELIVSPAEKGLGDHAPPITLSPAEGTFWGQDVGSVKQSQFNITITYRCFQMDDNGALTSALDAIAQAAGGVGQVPGNPYGWAFSLGGAAAAAASAAVQASSGNHLRLQVQQTIDKGALLDLTNGRTWTIRQTGDAGGLGGKWDWQLGIEAWGCSTPKPPPTP